MKKRLLSLLLIACMLMPMLTLSQDFMPIVETTATASDKAIMEEYIRTLDDAGYAPFSEYNELIIEQLGTVDVEEYENKFAFDKFSFDMIWKATQEAFGVKAYTQEYYELIFADYLAKVGEIQKNNAGEMQKSVEDAISILKNADRFNKIIDDLDGDEVLRKALMDLRNNKEEFIEVITGFSDIKNDEVYNFTLVNDTLELYSVALVDYTTASRYLNVLKGSVYQAAAQEGDAAVAIAMKRAVDKVCFAHQNSFSATLAKINEQIVDRVKKEVKSQVTALLTKKLSEIGLGAIATKFHAGVEFALFIKDLSSKSLGINQEVEATSKLALSFTFTNMLQCKFLEDGRKYMSDNSLSDEEYDNLLKLFDTCNAFQSLNYEYVDNLHVNGFWYNVNIAAGVSNDKFEYIADALDTNYLIDRYIRYDKEGRSVSIVDGGKCGEEVYWEITDKGELTIFGSGDMYGTLDSYGTPNFIIVGTSKDKYWKSDAVYSVRFEGNVTSIGCTAFGHCNNLKSITIPNGVKTIADGAFTDCKNLESVYIPESVTQIGENAFGATALREINLPNNISVLYANVFAGTNITELTIPESVTTIKAGFFEYMTSLEKVYMLSKHDITPDLGQMEICAGFDFTVYGYENAEYWVNYMNWPGRYVDIMKFLPQGNFIKFVSLDEVDVPQKDNSPTTPETPAPDYSNNPGGFSDVKTDDKYANAVVNMVNKGVINGYPDKSFRPNGTLTRAEAAAIICRLNGNFDLAMTTTKFTDAPKNNWASGYIAKANQLGIIDGVGNNKYNPNGTLTGEQWIKMAVCWLGLENDAKYYGGWPDGYVTVAKEHNILKNVASTNLKSNMSRADACVIADNTLPLKGKVAPSKPKVETKPTTQTTTKNETQFDPTSLVPYQDSATGYWGYKNKNGNVVIKAQYYGAEPFDEYGLAKVSYFHRFELAYVEVSGYINTKNEVIIPIKHFLDEFDNHGHIVAYDCTAETDQYSLYDRKGKAIAEKYDVIHSFGENNLAVACSNNVWGLLERSGNFRAVQQLQSVGQFSDGLAPALYKSNNCWGFVDESLKTIIEPKFQEVGEFAENGIAWVMVNNKWGNIDKSGKYIFEPQFDDAGCFWDNGIAIVEIDEKYGYINEKGEFVIEPQFDDVWGFAENGLARVKVGSKYGFINEKGAMVIEPQFYNTGDFAKNGLAVAMKKIDKNTYKYGYINEKSEFAIEPQFDDAWTFAENGLARVKINDKYGYINDKGKIVIEPRFDSAYDFGDQEYAKVEIDGKWGYINEKGEMR